MAEEKKKLIQFKNIVKSFEDGQGSAPDPTWS